MFSKPGSRRAPCRDKQAAMACKVIMPALGVAQKTGTLLKWLKAEGQSVTQGEPLMEVETDKSTVEFEAVTTGILACVVAQAGDEVPVGQTIALILAPGESLPSNQAVDALASLSPRPSPREPMGDGDAMTSSATSAAPFSASGARQVLASPKAKRMARERGIELQWLRGSGPEGAVIARDVLRDTRQTAQVVPPASAPATEEIIPLSPMRRIVGQRMTESKQRAPHFYLSMDIDMSAVSKLRSEWTQHSDAVLPSINDFIVYASARALKKFPAINSSFTQQGIRQHAEINIGIAVALQEGLVVPVLRNADRLSLTALAQHSRVLSDQAQNKKLLPLACEGGTFTVSNLGMFGVESFIAIINPPQCAILAVGRVTPRVVTDGDSIEIKPLMTATLSADHRVIDGASAARFLQHVQRELATAGAHLAQSHELSKGLVK